MNDRRKFLGTIPAALAVAAVAGTVAAADEGDPLDCIYLNVWFDQYNYVTRTDDVRHISIGPMDPETANAQIKSILRHGLLAGIHSVPSNRVRLIENRTRPAPSNFKPGERIVPEE